MNLLELNRQFQQFMQLIESKEGEISDEQLTELVVVETALITKVDSCVFVLDKLEAEAGFYKGQAERLAAYAQTCTSAHKRLKERILEAVKLSPGERIEGETVSFSTKSNPAKLVITDEALVPDEYHIVVVSVDNAKVKQAIKLGTVVPGAHVEHGQRLAITRPQK